MLNVCVGDVIEGEVVDFASEGEGVVKIDAYTVFVPFAIKGEVVRARVCHAKKDYAFANLIEVLSTSNDRIKPKCTYYGRCGGCDLQHLSSGAQLDIKRQSVITALRKVGGLNVPVDEVVRLNDWEYRNKIALPFGYRSKSARVVLGFYEKRSHSVVPMKWCPLHGEWASMLIADVTEWANTNKISVYDEITRKGLLRHLVARKLDTLIVTLVINGERVPKISELCQKLEEHFKDVCVYVNVNTQNTNAIFGKEIKLVCGKERKQNLGAYEAVVSPMSFLQVNNDVRDAIYDDVCGVLKDFDGDIVELYSGVGLLTAQIATRLKDSSITAVEIVPSATQNADALMKSLSLDGRVKNVCADALDFMASLENDEDCDIDDLPNEITSSPYYLGEQRKSIRARALILDPPRKGCDMRVLEGAKKAKFDKIVYVSCNPQTLARDLKILSSDYDVVRVTPYDMFPQTSNCEVLCHLVRR